jgi:ABC-type uncharacterized transport system permease subunit
MIFAGYDPFIATFCAILSGGVSGFVTGYLNVRWNILDTVLTVNNFFHYFPSKIINLVFIFALKGASFLSTP